MPTEYNQYSSRVLSTLSFKGKTMIKRKVIHPEFAKRPGLQNPVYENTRTSGYISDVHMLHQMYQIKANAADTQLKNTLARS